CPPSGRPQHREGDAMRHGCGRCGKAVKIERGSGGCSAYFCDECGWAGVLEGGPPRTSKYNAQKTEAEGIVFDSKAEAARWVELRLCEKMGGMRNLTRQVAYPLVVNGVLVSRYTSDFEYEERCPITDRFGESKVVEDHK